MINLEKHDYDVIIIGAGISGLTAAGKLSAKGFDILLLDKGRRVGGRMATRTAGQHRFDHGAQVLSPVGNEFESLTGEWSKEGLLRPVEYPVTDENRISKATIYNVPDGIAELPRYLAEGLNVQTSCRVTQLERLDNRWLVRTSEEDTFSTEVIFITPPVPQSLALLDSGRMKLPEKIYRSLSLIKYESCIALLLEGEINETRGQGAFIKPDRGSVSLIVDNYKKGVSQVPGAITVHMTRDFSESRWSLTDKELISDILNECSEYLSYKKGYLKIHRWRYSRVIDSYPEPYLMVETPGMLVFAGDGFSGGDIEGAVLSGARAAEAVISRTK